MQGTRARIEVRELLKELRNMGKTILISSHILHEVEAMTSTILLINRGQILAEGNISEIRDAIGRKIPYLLVVGEREAEADTVSVRERDGEDRGPRPVDEIIEEFRMLHRSRGRAAHVST